MKEIEVKAKLRNREKVVENLKKLGCTLSAPVTQDDFVYAMQVGSLEALLIKQVFLRLRVKNNSKVIFTAKKRDENRLVATEYETEVASRDEMEQAIYLMGYKDAVRLKKTRQTTEYEGCEICIDEVEGLGSFIEMEKLSDEADSEKVQDELFSFLVSIGVFPEDREHFGYDILLVKKMESEKQI